MNIEDLKQSWLDLREETRKQQIVTDELIRSIINDRVERLGQGFKVAGVLFSVGFICILAVIIPHIDLFINDFGGGLDSAPSAPLLGCGLIMMQYLLSVPVITVLYRAHRDITAADDLIAMSRALRRYSRLQRKLKPPMIVLQIVVFYIAMNILTDSRTALLTSLVTLPVVAAIYITKSRRDARDIREIVRRISALLRSDEGHDI